MNLILQISFFGLNYFCHYWCSNRSPFGYESDVLPTPTGTTSKNKNYILIKINNAIMNERLLFGNSDISTKRYLRCGGDVLPPDTYNFRTYIYR